MATFPYEDITNAPRASSPKSARKTLADGWVRKGRPAIRLDQPIPWTLIADQDRSWNFLLHSWDMIDRLLKAFCVTGDRRYFDPAVSVIHDWIARGQAADSPNVWYDMAVGFRAYRLAYVIDEGRRRGLLTPDELSAFEALLDRHRAYLAADANIVFHNNHGFYQVAGQLAMARRFPDDPAMAVAFDQGQRRFVTLMDLQFAPDGVHKEHSPDYHRMLAVTLRGLVEAGLIVDPQARDRVDGIERALSWFVTPQGKMANFGDSDTRSILSDAAGAKVRWRTREMQARATHGAIGAAPAETVKVFEQGGYYVVRAKAEDPSQDSYLAQTAAFHSRTHKHADDLSFIWHDRGFPILVDAGRYGYFGKAERGSDLWRDGYWYADPNRVFVETTRAHNCLEFDGCNHPRKDVKPYGSALKFWTRHGEVFAVESRVAHGSIRHSRVLIFNPGEWLIVLDNWRDLWTAHEGRQWFHAHPDFVTRREGAGYIMAGPATINVLPLLWAEAAAVIRGQAEPMQGWTSPGEKIMTANDAFAFHTTGRRGQMATLFAFGEVDEAACRGRSSMGEVRFDLSIGGNRQTVGLKRDLGLRLTLTR